MTPTGFELSRFLGQKRLFPRSPTQNPTQTRDEGSSTDRLPIRLGACGSRILRAQRALRAESHDLTGTPKCEARCEARWSTVARGVHRQPTASRHKPAGAGSCRRLRVGSACTARGGCSHAAALNGSQWSRVISTSLIDDYNPIIAVHTNGDLSGGRDHAG